MLIHFFLHKLHDYKIRSHWDESGLQPQLSLGSLIDIEVTFWDFICK